jgi:uncharacterized protein (TIGR03084 family)
VTGPDYPGLLADLVAEEDALDRVVADLDPPGWARSTPAEGWDVRDSIAHLAGSEDLARTAMHDPSAFAARRDEVLAAGADTLLGRGRAMPGVAVLAWWRAARGDLAADLARLGPRDRIGWFAGPMSAMSFVTARLMETWAHGQDIRDALHRPAEVSGRLRHVADLGVRTRRFSYQVRGLEPPPGDVRVELAGPDGAWAWGSPDSPDWVAGPAVDFCLVVTQRRHPTDTRLVMTGPGAAEWMRVAQAFAGPPTQSRAATR